MKVARPVRRAGRRDPPTEMLAGRSGPTPTRNTPRVKARSIAAVCSTPAVDASWVGQLIQFRTPISCVSGHEKLPSGGQVFSPLTDTRIPQRRTRFLPRDNCPSRRCASTGGVALPQRLVGDETTNPEEGTTHEVCRGNYGVLRYECGFRDGVIGASTCRTWVLVADRRPGDLYAFRGDFYEAAAKPKIPLPLK